MKTKQTEPESTVRRRRPTAKATLAAHAVVTITVYAGARKLMGRKGALMAGTVASLVHQRVDTPLALLLTRAGV